MGGQAGSGPSNKGLKQAQANLMKMYEAGIMLVGGTDAPYPGVFQGEGIQRELELLVESGLTPLQAITIVTRNAALLLSKGNEWGTLEAGKLANILVLNARPDQDISNTRNIYQVMLNGKILDRNSLMFDLSKDPGYREAGNASSDDDR